MSASRRRLWLIRESPAARLFATANRPDANKIWIPKSIVEHISWEKHVHSGQPREAEVTLPDWFIEQEDL